jgi:hypothetical protein
VNPGIFALGLLVAGAALVGYSRFFASWQRKVEAAWVQLAADLGLQPRGSSLSQREMQGEKDGVFVDVHEVVERSGKQSVTYTVAIASASSVPSDLRLGRESGWTSVSKLVAGEDVQTGDEQFDREILVKGPEPLALAVLDRESRSGALLEVLLAGTEFNGGGFKIRCRGELCSDSSFGSAGSTPGSSGASSSVSSQR